MALRFALATGFGCAAAATTTTGFRVPVARAADKPATPTSTSSASLADETAADPVRLVIVGGGYSGARLAYQLDSVYHVTLVDQKNYFEASDELPIVLNGPDESVQDRLDDIHGLHRYYLRRARVVTNTVVDVNEVDVTLSDGRRLPYDILVLAVGAKRPYPFAPIATTADIREAELKAYRTLLRRKDMHKIAIIGGNARGCCFASTLASACPDKDIHLFHSTSSLAPAFPYEARNRVEAMVGNNPCITVHRNRVVENVRYLNQPSIAAASVHRVTSWWPFRRSTAAAAAAANSTESATTPASVAAASSTPPPAANTAVDAEVQEAPALTLTGDLSGASYAAAAASTSGEQKGGTGAKPPNRHARCMYDVGKGPVIVDYEAQSAASTSPYLAAKYAIDCSVREERKKLVDSVLYQAWNGDAKKFEVKRGEEIGKETFSDFDLVINCSGNISNARALEKIPNLAAHIDASGHVIISKYNQLFGSPRWFAIGRSTNLKWVKSMGSSDFQSRTLFRNLLSIATLADNKAKNWLPTMAPLKADSMSFPRIIVPLDEVQAVGSTPWTGSVLGPIAMKEMTQDRMYYLKEFQKPMFFKQQEDAKVRKSVDEYFAAAATDPTDFDI